MERHDLRLRAGDLALLVDPRGRKYLVKLDPERTFHTHLGTIPHADLIGRVPGERVPTHRGHRFLLLRPTLAEYIQELPRATQIIYPKDLGLILVLADVFPGARVLEAGIGSGALTLALLRAVGPEGLVVSYEVREDVLPRALRNIREWYPEAPQHRVRLASVYEGIEEEGLDRVLLDVPEPWRALPHVARALVPGGILLSYLPTVLQVHRLVQDLHAHPCFTLVETVECLLRPWHITAQSARPEHEMVAHTGFLVTARRCLPPPSRDEDETEGGG